MGRRIRIAIIVSAFFSFLVTYYVMVVKKDYNIVTNADGPLLEEESGE